VQSNMEKLMNLKIEIPLFALNVEMTFEELKELETFG